MDNEIYSAPKADVELDDNFQVPNEVLKKIKNAWVAGLISAAITTVFTLVALAGTDIMGLNAFAFVDVGLIVIFAFGIYKRSRTCAILMLLFFVLNKIIMWVELSTASGIPLSLVFVWFYSMGIVGTFQYHKLKRRHKANCA
ncbi:hypothetical protein [Halioxenophilus sp. WMMB6]|uniref:hypothetical protein n=1 Tax=Halioxenophilus sp. WMMB6 TaxID=3073815 RepID=UPI00295F2460|nr:hypothetical protein [Halioxenophilus sp. WMMB6]